MDDLLNEFLQDLGQNMSLQFDHHSVFCPKVANRVKHKHRTSLSHTSQSAHHCLGLCLCLGGGYGVGRRQRSSSPAVCAWRRRPAWGRCSGAGGDTLAAPSPSQPAHRLRPSWSACSPDRRAAEFGRTRVSIKTVRLPWQQMKKEEWGGGG